MTSVGKAPCLQIPVTCLYLSAEQRQLSNCSCNLRDAAKTTVVDEQLWSTCCCKCSELTDEDVRTAIKNSGGVKGSLLIPEAPFELLVRRAISRLLPSALQCQQFVHAELLRIASQCAPADVTRFPNLQVGTTDPTV